MEGKNDYYTLNYFFKVILGKNEIPLIPGMNCSNSDTLISLYCGWGKEFFVFLDSDEGGQAGKKRYEDLFGSIVKDRLYTFYDVDPNWNKNNMESILPDSEKLKIQQYVFPDKLEYSKNSYNKAIQELLMNSTKIDISQDVIEKFEKIYAFMAKLYTM